MKKVSILLPCYNEEESLRPLYNELQELMNREKTYSWELLLVNDGSKDNTLGIIKTLREKDNRVNYLDLSRNFGKENAMLAGMDYVSGDCMVIMDADLQHPPRVISEMLKYWEKGYDDVYAKRDGRGKESWLRKRLSLLFYKILQKTSRLEIPQNVGDFRLLDRRCVEVLRSIRETQRYTKGIFAWIGFNKKEITFNQGDRIAGNTSWHFLSLFSFAIEGITSFTTTPLRLATIIGLLSSFASFSYLIFVLIKTMVYGEVVAGYPTLVVLILFLGGVQLFSIGIIGEYIGRIFKETKFRPPYIIKEHNGNKIKTKKNDL